MTLYSFLTYRDTVHPSTTHACWILTPYNKSIGRFWDFTSKSHSTTNWPTTSWGPAIPSRSSSRWPFLLVRRTRQYGTFMWRRGERWEGLGRMILWMQLRSESIGGVPLKIWRCWRAGILFKSWDLSRHLKIRNT